MGTARSFFVMKADASLLGLVLLVHNSVLMA
jgi:hypothetical protein